jgi:nitroreductase
MKSFTDALNWRYAVQVFDPEKKVREEDLMTILESGRLAPSMLGLEPWKFIVVTNPEVRAKLKEVGYGQPKITDASHLIVIAYRTDYAQVGKDRVNNVAAVQNQPVEALSGLTQMIEGSIAGQVQSGTVDTWLRSQSYIPLGMMLETAALLGVDAGPMGGFSPHAVDEILGLKAKNLHSTSMLALGYRGEDPAASRPKVRRPLTAVVEYIK